MNIDILGRGEFVERVTRVISTLSEVKTGCCFSIDGEWGAGKSFVLDRVENQLKDVQSEETGDNKYFLFKYNCWKYDYYDEPSIAIISSMLDIVDSELSLLGDDAKNTIAASWSSVKNKLLTIAGKFVENRIGIDVVDVYQDYKKQKNDIEESKNNFDGLFAFKKTLDETRKILKEIAKCKTTVMIVDELDRCIPEYAIRVLERLHHLFDGIPNIIVIVAIDSMQLEHSVKKIYGEDTEVKKYLKKFISFSLKLDKGNLKHGIFEKYNSFFSRFSVPNAEEEVYINSNLKQVFMDVEIREQEKMFAKAELLHSLVCDGIRDISLCFFEIMAVRYIAFRYNQNLSWIPKINQIELSPLKTGTIQECIPREHIKFLQNLEGKISKGRRVKVNEVKLIPELGESINDKVFWYFSQCCTLENYYFVSDTSKFKDEVESAKKFCELLKLID